MKKIRQGSKELVQLEDGSWGVKWPLPNGEFFIISPEDVPIAEPYNWWLLNKQGYVARKRRKGESGAQSIYFHREVLKAVLGHDDFEQGDHINRNTRDNRRENLRPCSHMKNQWNRGIMRNNTSGLIGVGWHKRKKKWQATIKIEGKMTHLGYYTDKHDAARAYDIAVLLLRDGHAELNFPDKRPSYMATIALIAKAWAKTPETSITQLIREHAA